MNKKKLVLGLIAMAAVAYSVGRFTGPSKIETREVERVVYRDRVVNDENRDVSRREKEITMPDGTKVRETIVEDRSKIHTDIAREGGSERLKETKLENRPDWRVGAVYNPFIAGYQPMSYGVLVERRLLGEMYVGVAVVNDGTVGVVVSLGF